MTKITKYITAFSLALTASLTTVFSMPLNIYAADNTEKTVKLRISNWEEYIDLGDWDEDELIELESADIIGERPMIDEFEEWYYETYGIHVNVEYSTFGTNEDLYNMLTLGDVFDLVCPSEYMVMKLMAENRLQPLSDEFFDTDVEYNYYSRGISPYIKDVMDSYGYGDESWSKYMACYMWGITGFVYNPELVDAEDVSTLNLLDNKKYSRRISLKDNVRDSYFAALGAIKHDLLTSEEFINDPNYKENITKEMNDTSPETIAAALKYLQDVKDNAFSFETDAGKADLITGKAVANYQWSGDGTYTLDQAEEDDFILNFAVPEEASNIYFDGWCMLKDGISENPAKQHAAEAFINYISRSDNVVRNEYYVGYTSGIAGCDDNLIFEYADYCYGAEDNEEDVVDYPLGYFFTGDNDDEDFVITAPSEQLNRQLSAMYPSLETMDRTCIMEYFDADTNAAINQMWINVRCFNITKMPVYMWIIIGAAVAGLVILLVRKRKHK